MPTDPKVLAICVNWNGREVLPGLLQSLSRSDHPALETLVVDCGSNDGSADLVTGRQQLLQLGENVGYGAALNRALLRAFRSSSDAEYFLLLNNDLVFEANMIGHLVEFAEARGIGVCAPRILRYRRPDRLDAAWGRITWSHVLCRFKGRNRRDGRAWKETRRAQLLLGCALLVHRQVFERLGLFDEAYFMYHEEVDFLYRCLLEGIPAYYCPFVSALHHGAHGTRRAPRKRVYWIRRNTVYFMRKHRAGPLRWLRFWTTLAAAGGLNLALLRWLRQAAILRGVRDGWRMPLMDPSSPSLSQAASEPDAAGTGLPSRPLELGPPD